MKRMHETQKEKKNKNHMVIKPEDLNIRNEMHFDIQRKTKAQVFEDKRKKPAKHKKNLLDEE